MPPEISPWGRKEFFRERKNERCWSENVVWRDRDRHHDHHHQQWGWNEYRRPTGYGKQGAHMYSEDFARGSGPSRPHQRIFDDVSCLPIGKYGRNSNRDTWVGPFSQRDWRGRCWDAAPAPPSNGCANMLPHVGMKRSADDMLAYNYYPHFTMGNNWDRIHFKDQHHKNSAISGPHTGKRYKRKNWVGSIDRKPLKWTRNGSLPSRGSGFRHSSSPKSAGLDSGEIKVALHPRNPSPVHSLSENAAACATTAPAEETNSRKKPRLGWGEGLAKFEKIINGSTDTAEINGTTEALQSNVSENYTEPVHSLNSNTADRISKVQCFTACSSPATPSTVACCSSPGEDKLFVKTVNADTANLCSSPCPESQNQIDGLGINLENLEATALANLSSLLSELLQSDNLHSADSGFIRSNAMSKLLVLKADIAKKLEITESEIDPLENELKTLISDTGHAGPCPTSSSSLPVKCILKPSEELCATSDLVPRPAPLGLSCSADMMKKKSPGSFEGKLAESRDEGIDCPGTATEPLSVGTTFSEGKTLKRGESTWNADLSGDEDREGISLEYAVDEESLGATFSRQIARRECMLSTDVGVRRENMLYDLLTASNKDSAHKAAEVFSKLLPANLSVDISSIDAGLCWKNKALVREKLVLRKRFLRFKERVITLKYRTFQHMWNEDLGLSFARRSCPKSRKKFELSLPLVYRSNLKHRSSIRARYSSRAGNLSLVPTAEVINFARKLLADSHAKRYRSDLKMPSLVLDYKEKIALRFISNNGLVEDPSAAEKERCMVNPWTSKEKEIFLDRLATFGKDFRKIASFLDHKTTADCIEFYYKNHKSDCFQRAKKPEFPKQGISCSTSPFLVTSGKQWDRISNAASLDMLGADSAIASNVDDNLNNQQKCSRKVSGTCNPKTWGDDGISTKSSNPDIVGFERETIAADVLAGICGSLASKAMSSCITSSMDFGEGYQESKGLDSSVRQPLIQEVTPNVVVGRPSTHEVTYSVVDETCSDESCGEIEDPPYWTDEEKSSLIQAVTSYGKDFTMVSQYVRTRSIDQCRVFFSKARKCLKLDLMHPGRCHGMLASDEANGGGGSDNEDACAVVCNEKSGSWIHEDQLLSSLKENLDEIQPVGTTKRQPNFDLSEEQNRKKKLDVKDTKHSSDNFVSGNHAEEKAELDLNGGSSVENCFNSETLTVQDRENRFFAADTIVREDDHRIPSILAAELDIKSVGEVYGDTSRAENVGHGISIPCWSLNGKRVGFADVNSTSLSSLSCPIQGTKTTPLSAGSPSLAIGINPSAKCVLVGGEDKYVKLLDPLQKPPIISYKSQNILAPDYASVQSIKSLNHDMASQFDSGKFSNKQFQNSVSTDKHYKHSCKKSSLVSDDPSQIGKGYPVSILTKNGINGDIISAKQVSALNKSKVPRHFSAQRHHLQKCNSLEDAESELHCLSQYQLKDPGRPKLQCFSDLNKPRHSGDVKLFGQILNHPSNSRAQEEDHAIAKLSENSFNPKFTANQNMDGILTSSKYDRNNYLGIENLPTRSFGFWDGNKIQTGFPSLLDSANLLPKYPTTSSKNDSSLNGASVFPGGDISSNGGVADYQSYRSREFPKLQTCTADKKQQEMCFPQRFGDGPLSLMQGRRYY